MPLTTVTKKAQDIYNYVARVFGDEAAVQVTAADVISWINMGQREILIQNPMNKATAVRDLVADQQIYDPSDLDILRIQSIWINGNPIDHKTFQEAEQYIVSQDTLNQNRGLPVLWWDWSGSIYLYPTPSTTWINGLQIFYLKNAPAITALTDYLGVPDQFFNRLCEYVMSQAYELDEDSQNSQFKLGQFQQGVQMLSEVENNVSNNYYPTITQLQEDDDWIY